MTRFGGDRLVRFRTGVAALAGVVAALDARFGWGRLTGLVVPLLLYTLYTSTSGFIVVRPAAPR